MRWRRGGGGGRRGAGVVGRGVVVARRLRRLRRLTGALPQPPTVVVRREGVFAVDFLVGDGTLSRIEMGRQRQFEFRTWGGRRAGAGRKPRGKTAGVAHAPRPVFGRTLPVH